MMMPSDDGSGTPRGDGSEESRPSDATSRELRLEELVMEFILAQEEGEDPQVEDWISRYPTFAEDLAILLSDPSAPRPLEVDLDKTISAHAAAEHSRLSIGPWEILEQVAKGGGGTVYRARHESDGHVVALKVMDLVLAHSARDLERFEREARMLQSMDLVSVVPIESTGEDGGRLWIAMKWIEGSTLDGLANQLRDGSKEPRVVRLHPMGERARLIARIARAFEAIHGYGILHRDIKPGNLLVDRLGEPMIIDFGIARAPDLGELTMTSDGPMGTPRYLAPELLEGGNAEVVRETDIYGLGLCLYELVTGTRAFVQRTRTDLFTQIRTQGPLEPSRANPEVPHPLSAIILRATAIRPDRRYPSMQAFADDLERFARGQAPDVRTLRQAAPWRRYLSRNRRTVLLAAAVVVALGMAAPWVLDNLKESARIQEQEAEVRQLAETVDPWFLAPPEAGPLDDNGLQMAAEKLSRMAPHRSDLRLRAAWIPFLSGHYEEALELLGPRAEQEDDPIALFRAWLEFRVGGNLEGEILRGAVVPSNTDPEGGVARGRFDVKDIEREGDWSQMAEGVRRRLRAPSPAAIETFLGDWDYEADEVGPEFVCMRGILRWLSVPDAFAGALPRRILRPCRRDLEFAEKNLPGRPWAGLLLAAIDIRYGDRAAARVRLDRAAEALPDSPEVAYLCALAYAEEDGDRPLRELERAADLMPRRKARRQVVHGGTLFEDQLERKVYGHLALFELARGRPDRAQAAVHRWKDALSGAHWHDEVLRLLFEARIAAARADSARARELIAEASKQAPKLVTPLLEEARLAEKVEGSPEVADRLRKRATDPARYPLQAPRSLEQWLQAGWFGFRPYVRVGGFGSALVRPPPRD